MNRCYFVFLILFFGTFNSYANADSLLIQEIEKADSLDGIGKTQAAISLLKGNRNLSIFAESSCSNQALYYHKMGIYYYYSNDYKETLNYWRDSALQIRLTCLGPMHEDTANSYFAVGIAFREIGDRKKEGDNLLQTINILESLPKKDTMTIAYRYLQIGMLYDDLGDFEVAENYLLRAQQYYKDLGIQSHKHVASLLNALGILKKNQEEYQEAINYLQLAINTYKNINSSENEQAIADCYQNLGTSYMYLENYTAANKNALIALKGYQQFSNHSKVSLSYELLGNISKKQKRYAIAFDYFKQSLALRKKHALPKEIANTYENIADLFAEQKQFDVALKNYQTSISYLIPDLRDDSGSPERNLQYELVLDKLDLLRVLSLKAKTLLSRYQEDGEQQDLLFAHSLHQQLDTLIVKIRQQYKAPGSKFFLAQKSLPIYEEAVETALTLYEQTKEAQYLEEAYIFCAKNKAIVLLDGQQDLNAKFVGIPTNLLEKEKALKKNTRSWKERYSLR